MLLAFGEVDREFIVAPDLRVLRAPELAIKRQIVPLALTRGMIHQAREPKHPVVDMPLDERQQAAVGQFAAEMEIVVRLQQSGGTRAGHCVDDRLEHRRSLSARVIVAERQRIENRGNAAADQLRIVRQRGVELAWPGHAGPRPDVVLDVVRVQVDQAGNQKVAVAVDNLAIRRRGAAVLCKGALTNPEVGFFNGIFSDDACVLEMDVHLSSTWGSRAST